MDYSIDVKNLCKIYNRNKKTTYALDNLNLKIPQGSFYGLLGPNGAGKSTFINILAGSVIKTSGDVKLCGIDLDMNNIEARYSIGVVPQELILDPFFTVKETLENYCRYYGVKNIDKTTDKVIEALGLGDKANIHPRKLSGGMQRRLLVAKALVHSPKILILDEPTAGVDIELREQLWNYIKKLNKSGTTIILTTHYFEEAQSLCDQIAIISKGKLVANDTKENLINKFGYKKLTIKFAQNLINIPDSLKRYDIQFLSNNIITLQYKPSEKSINEILQIIIGLNIAIDDVIIKETELSEIFTYFVN